MTDWIVNHWDLVFGILGSVLAIATLLVKLTTNVIDDLVISFLKQVASYFASKKPAPTSPSEPQGTEDIPDKLPPSPDSPAGALKRTMDRKIDKSTLP